MSRTGRLGPAHSAGRKRGAWRPSFLSWCIAGLVLVGLGVFLYPQAASWFSQLNQSRQLDVYSQALQDPQFQPSAAEQIAAAQAYNDALQAGAIVAANSNKPVGDGTENSKFDYFKLLRVDDSGLMARIKMDAIGLDLPIFHGTADDTLLRGAGHLQGSSLPVGGVGTHSVITAHRGLANATMFSHLDQVKPGDRFVLEVLGEVLTYEVRSTVVVDPDDTETLHAQAGKDLVTLITCTPLGINSHRILVTGERVEPTPIEDVEAVGESPDIPGFPWWAVIGGAGVLVVTAFMWRSGYVDAALRARAARAAQRSAQVSIGDDSASSSGTSV